MYDMTQVYDRDLTTDDFMGSSSVTLSDLEMEKWVPQWEYWSECREYSVNVQRINATDFNWI